MSTKPYKRRKIQIVEGGMQSRLSTQLTAWLYVFLVVFSFIVYAPAFLTIFTGDSASEAYAEAVAQFGHLPLDGDCQSPGRDLTGLGKPSG